MLKKGAVLSVRVGNAAGKDGRLFAQVSGVASEDASFWIRPEPGLIITRRLAAGPHTVRAVQRDADGSTWFSDVTSITAVTDRTNDLAVNLKRGATVQGQLDSTVPRPVQNGRVVAHVWPQGCKPQDAHVILMGDCYNSADRLLSKPGAKFSWGKEFRDFQGVSDGAGLAVLPNVPATVNELAVEHPRFALPAVAIAGLGKHRQASFTLIPGQTNRVFIQLEPREQSPITHY